jgi:tRNA threonylcarbamoyladenosine biosynthesis protein TsaE
VNSGLNSELSQTPLATTQLDPIFLPDPAATLQLGAALGQILIPGSVLLLEGELGSGKTTLTQGLGQGLAIQDTIDSPTFTLVNEYLEGKVPLYHFDLYRLDAAEVAALAIETYWEATEVDPGIVVIEWSERLPYRPPAYLQLTLTYDPSSGRQAQLSAIGAVAIEGLQQFANSPSQI